MLIFSFFFVLLCFVFFQMHEFKLKMILCLCSKVSVSSFIEGFIDCYASSFKEVRTCT